MSKTLIGNIKGPKGDTGEKGATGDKGATGATGTRGSRWSEGTAITGTSTTAAVFSETGITDALVNDYYLNTSTGNVYRCTISGNASTAKWVYVANIKGKAGEVPTDGSNMTATFAQASSRTNIASEETHTTIFGKIMKWFADLTAAAFAQMISSYSDLMSNTVSGYVPDALAVKSGFATIGDALSFQSEEITNKSWLYSPSKNNVLRVQDDGNVVLYNSDNNALWDINSTKGKITGYATLFTGVHTIQFTDGVGHMPLLDFSENNYFGQLIGVVVNGFGTAHCFAASISDANVNTCDVIIKCITDTTLTAEQNVSVIYSFSWLGN